jgi:hypothetical protein
VFSDGSSGRQLASAPLSPADDRVGAAPSRAKLPGSTRSAVPGIYVHNQPMVASLFRGVPAEQFRRIGNVHVSGEFDDPSGDATRRRRSPARCRSPTMACSALHGQQRGGRAVNRDGAITGWLNGLAFAPVDYGPSAPVEEWWATACWL